MTLELFKKNIAVAYIARGADKDSYVSFNRFIESYKNKNAGLAHTLYIIYKGFLNIEHLEIAKEQFKYVPHKALFFDDSSFDIGAYIEFAKTVECDFICGLNTATEILSNDWLWKLSQNLSLPNVGLVGATASYESLNKLDRIFSAFPNPHIRTTGFMINRKFFLSIAGSCKIINKLDAYKFESGPQGLTSTILLLGMRVLLVGANGRGYSMKFWPISKSFRQGLQENLLIADNVTRLYMQHPWIEKYEVTNKTWGDYIGSCHFSEQEMLKAKQL